MLTSYVEFGPETHADCRRFEVTPFLCAAAQDGGGRESVAEGEIAGKRRGGAGKEGWVCRELAFNTVFPPA